MRRERYALLESHWYAVANCFELNTILVCNIGPALKPYTNPF